MSGPWWRDADDWSAGRRQSWADADDPAPGWMRPAGRRPAESAAVRLRFALLLAVLAVVPAGLIAWSLRTGG